MDDCIKDSKKSLIYQFRLLVTRIIIIFRNVESFKNCFIYIYIVVNTNL
jgi:hypothetical protein